MMLEGTVSNVAAFGAFVDLGVHQDGLIHVSQLSNKFISDAREVVKTGDIVKVKVLEVDVARQRISLSMKTDAVPVSHGKSDKNHAHSHRDQKTRGAGSYTALPSASGSAMASAFAKLQSLKK
jgi:uncharacterized protein